MSIAFIIDTAKRINSLHAGLKLTGVDLLTKMAEIGEQLMTVKSQIGHGGWGEWVKDNLTFSISVAL